MVFGCPSFASCTPAPGYSVQRECGPSCCLMYACISASLVRTGLLHTHWPFLCTVFHMAVGQQGLFCVQISGNNGLQMTIRGNLSNLFLGVGLRGKAERLDKCILSGTVYHCCSCLRREGEKMKSGNSDNIFLFVFSSWK